MSKDSFPHKIRVALATGIASFALFSGFSDVLTVLSLIDGVQKRNARNEAKEHQIRALRQEELDDYTEFDLVEQYISENPEVLDDYMDEIEGGL